MNLDKYLRLTGLTLTKQQEDDFSRVLVRAELKLQRLLGWKAGQRSLYEEAGKLNNECSCIDQTMTDDQYQNLINGIQAPDEEQGTIRLYPYNNLETRMFIDPATAVYAVKLVVFVRGSDQQFLTIKTLKNWMPIYEHNTTVDDSARVFCHYVELCKDDVMRQCGCRCTGCAFLMVDGDFVRQDYPDDLRDLLVQLITQEYQNPFTLNPDQNRIITSESVQNHSVSYLVTDAMKKGQGFSTGIETEEWFIDLIKPWIGPFSPLYKRIHIT